MLGSIVKNQNAKQSRRLYLFFLVSAVIFLALACVVPQQGALDKQTVVGIKIEGAEDADQVSKTVIQSIKKQLSPDQLRQTLIQIEEKCALESKVLGNTDISAVRKSLMSGALNLDAHSNADSAAENGPLAFSIALTGSGSGDEQEFVQRLAESIRVAVDPETAKENALLQLSQIQSQIREFESLHQETRQAMNSTMEKIASDGQMVAEVSAKAGGDSEDDWELKNLSERRKLAYEEYEKNKSLQFDEKQAVQNSLIRQIDYLDREIKRIQQRNSQTERLAEKENNVRKASYFESEDGQQSTDSEALQDLKTELALAMNKLELARNVSSQTRIRTRQLSELLQQKQLRVTISEAKVDVGANNSLRHVWVLLAVSGLIGGFMVMRLDSRAFATLLNNSKTIESSLQLPVIGEVQLPDQDQVSSRIQKTNQWVRRMTRLCELLLLGAFLIFLIVLLINSEFTFYWLSDPVQVLKNSFN